LKLNPFVALLLLLSVQCRAQSLLEVGSGGVAIPAAALQVAEWPRPAADTQATTLTGIVEVQITETGVGQPPPSGVPYPRDETITRAGAGAVVTVRWEEPRSTPGDGGKTRTAVAGRRGEFCFERIPVGSVVVSATTTGVNGQPWKVEERLNLAETADVRLILKGWAMRP
jgi:hypothetical protein